MSSTISLQKTINFCSMFARLSPLTGVGGFVDEPGITMGNLVRSFMLSAPFAWRWNRASTSFTCTQGTQDYQKNLTDFGWLEKATANDTQKIYELYVTNNLGEENQQNLLFSISSRLDDDAGNITFRVTPAPDKPYTVVLSYQKASPVFQGLGDLWSPIPDYYSHIYTQGMLAKMYEYMDDPKFAYADQRFLRQVIAANEGISESMVNIFLSERVNYQRTLQSGLENSGIGRQGRSGI